jgi:uncharacterized protein YfaT (DUF1175 family)
MTILNFKGSRDLSRASLSFVRFASSEGKKDSQSAWFRLRYSDRDRIAQVTLALAASLKLATQVLIIAQPD